MEELLRFIELTQKFKAVKRQVILAEEGRKENDAEHSFQLALVAWYLISSKKLNLNLDRAVRYALAHDLVEVYAGDIPFNSKDHSSKHKKEAEALARIKEQFPEFPDLTDVISAYENREDEESKFIYALDKVLPPMNIYLDKGYTWKVENITLEDLIRLKNEKVSASAEVKEYWDSLVSVLEREQETLFNS